jgi:hypothetical protein
MGALQTVATDQKRWSLTASEIKASIGLARWTILILAVSGAVLETWGAQIQGHLPALAQAAGYLGTAALVVVAVIRQWKLGHDRVRAWILARSASEALKRELYLYRTGTGPYAIAGAEETLLSRREQILAKVQAVQGTRVEPKGEIQAPAPLNASGYLAERINGAKGQIPFFLQRAAGYAKTQRILEGLEFFLALLGAALGAALTMTGKQAYGAWVAVITTVSAAVAAHVIAQRYEQLAVSYRATADRLAGIAAGWQAKKDKTLAQLVEPCEDILLEENQGWIAGTDDAKQSGLGTQRSASSAN